MRLSPYRSDRGISPQNNQESDHLGVSRFKSVYRCGGKAGSFDLQDVDPQIASGNLNNFSCLWPVPSAWSPVAPLSRSRPARKRLIWTTSMRERLATWREAAWDDAVCGLAIGEGHKSNSCDMRFVHFHRLSRSRSANLFVIGSRARDPQQAVSSPSTRAQVTLALTRAARTSSSAANCSPSFSATEKLFEPPP